MKEKKKPSPSSIQAAERVRKLFPKENQNFCYTLKQALPPHHYDPVIIPKIPSGTKSLAFYGSRLKATSKKQRHWNSKQKGGDRALTLTENFSEQGALNPDRVKICKLKEHHLASRKLKMISLQKQVIDHLKNKFTIFSENLSQDFVKDERMEYWEALLQNKEERHFNIGRIIKYLSD
ncbi:MAG: hypothetical protein V4494_05970 [Chlamydiota bacterium]